MKFKTDYIRQAHLFFDQVDLRKSHEFSDSLYKILMSKCDYYQRLMDNDKKQVSNILNSNIRHQEVGYIENVQKQLSQFRKYLISTRQTLKRNRTQLKMLNANYMSQGKYEPSNLPNIVLTEEEILHHQQAFEQNLKYFPHRKGTK